jgi:transposase InsO family protein
MSEAFVNTLRRDYLAGADRSTAASVLDQIPDWSGDYNGVAPHSALGYRAPVEYRQLLQDGQATSAAGLKERTVRS